MIFAVISDIHSNLEALRAVLKRCRKEKVEAIYCLGDIIGYNANPKECLQLVKKNCQTIVKGNHEAIALDLEAYRYRINPLALTAIEYSINLLKPKDKIWLNTLPLTTSPNPNFTLAHSAINHPGFWDYIVDYTDYMIQIFCLKTRIGVIGHTHVPAAYNSRGKIPFENTHNKWLKLDPNEKYLFNAGSVGQPRNDSPLASFMIFDYNPPQIRYRFIQVPYDIDKTAQKIIAAGLPERLAERLYSAE